MKRRGRPEVPFVERHDPFCLSIHRRFQDEFVVGIAQSRTPEVVDRGLFAGGRESFKKIVDLGWRQSRPRKMLAPFQDVFVFQQQRYGEQSDRLSPQRGSYPPPRHALGAGQARHDHVGVQDDPNAHIPENIMRSTASSARSAGRPLARLPDPCYVAGRTFGEGRFALAAIRFR